MRPVIPLIARSPSTDGPHIADRGERLVAPDATRACPTVARDWRRGSVARGARAGHQVREVDAARVRIQNPETLTALGAIFVEHPF